MEMRKVLTRWRVDCQCWSVWWPSPTLYRGQGEGGSGWGLSRRGELDKMGGGQSQWLAVGREAVTTRPPPLAHLLLLGPVRIWRR
jgi:hypothetical protein